MAGEIDLAVHSAKDVPGALADGLRARRRRRRGPTRARRAWSGALGGWQRRAGRDELAAAARAAALGAAGPRGRRAAGQRRHAPAQARRGRGRRDRARRARASSGSGSSASATPLGLRARARARARSRSRRGRTTSGCGRRSGRCMTRPPSRPWRPSGPPCAYWTRLVTRPWESTRDDGTIRGFVGLPDGSAWVADELRRDRRRGARAADARRRAPATCSRRRRRWRERRARARRRRRADVFWSAPGRATPGC